LKMMIGEEQREYDNEVSIGVYENGREQGFSAIIVHHVNGKLIEKDPCRYVCWSEYRSSDELIVYCGYNKPIARGISDEMYKSARGFKTNDYMGAAVCIYEFLFKM